MKLKHQFQLGLTILLFFSLTAYDLPSSGVARPAVSDNFIWHDLVTPNMDKSMAFYSSVFGWTFKDIKVKGLRMATIYSGDRRIGGAIEVPKANTAVWIKAIGVANLEDRVNMVEKNGGRVVLPPVKIPGRGTLVIMEGAEGEEFSFLGDPDASLADSMGAGNNSWLWSELWANVPESSQAFYESVFGVTTENTTSEDKPYWVFLQGDQKLAGMIKNPITNQGTQWVPYVQSSDPEAIIGSARDNGAYIVLEPSPEIRDGGVGIFQDPLGALVCVQRN